MVAKFCVGERVIGPPNTRGLSLFEIEEIYLNNKGEAVYKALRLMSNSSEILKEESLSKAPGRFVVWGSQIWDSEHPMEAVLLSSRTGVGHSEHEELLERIVKYLNEQEWRL